MARVLAGGWLLLLATASYSQLSHGPVDFSQQIAPILRARCLSCHSSSKAMSGLSLENRESAMKGGYSGPAIRPGKSAESRLIRLVAGLEKGTVMPMGGNRLTSDEVSLLRTWIDQGAEWPASLQAQAATASKPAHWAFVPPRKPPLPNLRNAAPPPNPIDGFIQAKLKEQGIQPLPQADRSTLIRRVSLDLTGLPPSPKEVETFLADGGGNAYDRLADRLLDSPHYGEKWARHWLDLAHYADSDGYEKDLPRPYAWLWRDWVIRALNSNMPFDRFTIEQLAGDLLPGAGVEQKIATGFNRNTLSNREGGIDREEFRVEQVVDRAATLGTVWLGLTVGCARCHDHKYDPITQKEFYQLYAFFDRATEASLETPQPGEKQAYLQKKPEADRKRREALLAYNIPALQAEWERKVLQAAEHPGRDPDGDFLWGYLGILVDGGQEILRLSPAQRTDRESFKLTRYFLETYKIVVSKERYAELKFKQALEDLSRLDGAYPRLAEAQTLAENPHPTRTRLFVRGDFRQPGIEVEPGTPAILPAPPPDGAPNRLALARWLVSKDNPLTARVAVNRMWQEFFGRGLVESSDDFGVRGERPSHPELLDWLAAEFMESGWNVKRMHKLIVTSATYQRSSQVTSALQKQDPSNKLLARQSRLRLPAELVRDSALTASGLLNPAIGGRSFHPPLPMGVDDGYSTKWTESHGPELNRRGLYIFFQRRIPFPQLMTFDAPDSLLSCSRRERSTTPLQALNLLNDAEFFRSAQALGERIQREKPGSVADRIDYAFQLCLSRAPSAKERQRLADYYHLQKDILASEHQSGAAMLGASMPGNPDPTEAAAWVGTSSVLLNLEEFITRR